MTLTEYEIYAGMTGFASDKDDALITCRYSRGSAHRYAMTLLSNPYTWALVVEAATGVATLNLMAEHHGRIH